MSASRFSNWLRSPTRKSQAPRWARRRKCRGPAVRFLPRLEGLEGRTLPSTITVLNALDSGSGSLREALAIAASGDTIDFDPGLAGQTITLTSRPLTITN